MQWANDVLAKYPERTAILLTHAYLYNDNTRYDYAAKGKSQAWTPHSMRKRTPTTARSFGKNWCESTTSR